MPKGCHFIAISCQGIESAKVDHELIEAQLIQTAQISVLKRYAVFSGITNNRTQTNIIALTLGCSIKILRGFGRTLHRRSSLSSVKILGNRTIGSILFPSKKVRGLQWNHEQSYTKKQHRINIEIAEYPLYVDLSKTRLRSVPAWAAAHPGGFQLQHPAVAALLLGGVPIAAAHCRIAGGGGR